MSISDSDLLVDVNEAIRTIVRTGQSYTLKDGTSFTRGSLNSLMDLRDQLSSSVTRQRAGGGAYKRIGFGEPV